MNKQSILTALEQIEVELSTAAIDDPQTVSNAIAVIRCEMRGEQGLGGLAGLSTALPGSSGLAALAPETAAPPLDPDKFFAMTFEREKSYLVFVEAGAVDAGTLMYLPPGPETSFIFVYPDGQPVRDKFLQVPTGAKVFADSRYVTPMDGITLVDTGDRDLREVLVAEGGNT